MKQNIYFIGMLFLVFGVAMAYRYYYTAPASKPLSVVIYNDRALLYAQSSVLLPNVVIPVEVAKGIFAVQKGLSGRPSLNADSGMLFLFSAPARHRFWMPNMHFPIDIIWINNERVIDISHDVSNNFNALNPRLYSPKEPAQYVLEVNAGFAQKKGIMIGDTVSFH